MSTFPTEPTHTVALTAAEIDLLREALDSHEYWQLSDENHRNSGLVLGDGADDAEAAEHIRSARSLATRLESIATAPAIPPLSWPQEPPRRWFIESVLEIPADDCPPSYELRCMGGVEILVGFERRGGDAKLYIYDEFDTVIDRYRGPAAMVTWYWAATMWDELRAGQ